MRLLICTQIVDTNDSSLGFFHSWINGFASRIDRVHVICLKEGTHALPATTLVHSLGKESNASRFLYLWRFYRYAWKYRHDYDAVFVHMNPEYVILGGMLWRLLGKRIGFWYTHKTVNLRLYLATAMADIIFTASPESFRIDSPKVRDVGHGIEASSCTAQLFHAPLRLVSVGRISPIKNYELMFEALKLLKEAGTPAQLTLIGAPVTDADHSYLESLKQQAKDLGVTVIWQGGIPHREIAAALCAHDIFINCSNTGSLDKAVLEAMSAGLLVVTSNEGLRSTLEKVDPEAIVSAEAKPLAARIQYLSRMEPREIEKRTRAYKSAVEHEHGLYGLVARILNSLST